MAFSSVLARRYVGYALTTKWEGSGERMQVIGFDMGGTSTDVSRFAGSYEHVFESTTAGAAYRLLADVVTEMYSITAV